MCFHRADLGLPGPFRSRVSSRHTKDRQHNCGFNVRYAGYGLAATLRRDTMANANQPPLPRLLKRPWYVVPASLVKRRYTKYLAFYFLDGRTDRQTDGQTDTGRHFITRHSLHRGRAINTQWPKIIVVICHY